MKFDKLTEAYMNTINGESEERNDFSKVKKPDPIKATADEAYEAIKNGLWSIEDFNTFLRDMVDFAWSAVGIH